MVVLPSSNESDYDVTAVLAPLLDDTFHYIHAVKDWETLQYSEIRENEAAKCIAASPSLSSEHITAPCMQSSLEPAVANALLPTIFPSSRTVPGKGWLRHNACRLLNEVECSGIFENTFSQFLIIKATSDI